MNWHTLRKEVHGRVLAVLFAVGACSLLGAAPVMSGEGQSCPAERTEAASSTAAAQPPAQQSSPEIAAGGSGLTIYVDPRTGRILKQPAPGTVPFQLTPELQNALSTSHQGLVEVPSSVPGGGVRIDLQGRFQNPLFATIDADGNLKLHHLQEKSPSPPTAGENRYDDAPEDMAQPSPAVIPPR